MNSKTGRMAVLGGNRLPFARSNSAYADASNQEMLTAAIDGLVTRYGLEGVRLGEVVAGAVLKHARDFDRHASRCWVRSWRRRLRRPTSSRRAARVCRLPAIIASKIALGRIESGIAGGTDTTSDAPVAISDKLRRKLMKVNAARDTAGRVKALGNIRPGDIGIEIPQNGEPRRTKLSMGEHAAALTALEWQIGQRGAGRACGVVASQARGGLRPWLHGRPGHAFPWP